MQKGESLRDTVQTIEAMGIDAVVVRHPAAGAPHRVAVVDRRQRGQRRRRLPRAPHAGAARRSSRCVAISAPIARRRAHRHRRRHRCTRASPAAARSRSPRSAPTSPSSAPPTLLPSSLEGWPVTVSHDLDDVLPELDVVYLLRIQHERQDAVAVPVACASTPRATGSPSSAPRGCARTRSSCTRAR